MIAALVTALTASVVYVVLYGCAPDLTREFGFVYALVILASWAALVWKAGRR